MRRMKRSLTMAFGLLCMLSACANPHVQPFFEREEPAVISDAGLRLGDGVMLPLRRWIPTQAPSAVIIGLHGFNDYSKAFDETGEFFRERGVAFYAYDQRGFGENKEGRGIWGGKENLTNDARQMVEAAKATHPDVPVFLLGESMGGAVVINTVIMEDAPELDGIILSAPAVWGDETMNGFYRSTLWLMAHTFPEESFTGRGLGIVASDNTEMLREMARDPNIIKETRVDAVYGILHLMDDAYRGLPQVTLPTLMLYGENDQVIPKEPILNAIHRLKAPYTMALYPDGYHLLMRDLKGEMVMYDVYRWIENRYTPLPSGHDMGWKEAMALK